MSNRITPPPISFAEIDRTNPLSGSLVASWLPGRSYDVTRRQTPMLVLGSSMSVAAGIGSGLAWRGVQSANSYVDTQVTSGTLGINGASPRAILAVFRPNVGSGVGGAVWGVGVGGTSNADFSLRQREDGGTNAWRLQVWANDVDFLLPNTAGTMRAVLVNYDGTSIQIYDGAQNGALIASMTVALTTPNVRFLVGKWDYNGSDTYGFNGDVAGVHVFNRSFSAQDAAKLLRSPWQVDRTPTRRNTFYAATTSTTISPTPSAVQVAGYAPTIARGVTNNVTPDAASGQFTGYAPTVTQGMNTSVAPTAATLLVTGYSPTIAQTNSRTVAPTPGVLQMAGYSPTVSQSVNLVLQPTRATMVLTGYAPTVAQKGPVFSATVRYNILPRNWGMKTVHFSN
jgi:hypothetical protein